MVMRDKIKVSPGLCCLQELQGTNGSGLFPFLVTAAFSGFCQHLQISVFRSVTVSSQNLIHFLLVRMDEVVFRTHWRIENNYPITRVLKLKLAPSPREGPWMTASQQGQIGKRQIK